MIQAIFCIDPRLEGLRRHLESIGNYQTYGFSGYFGLAFELQSEGNDTRTQQCPHFIEPKNLIKCNPNNLLPDADWIIQQNNEPFGFSLTDATHLAEIFLRTMGLTKDFSHTVIICGHDDCAACNRNAGSANAIIMSTILNHKQIRKMLADKKIFITDETHFVAANYNPLNKEVEFFSPIDSSIETDFKAFQTIKLNPVIETNTAQLFIGPYSKAIISNNTFLQSYDPDQDPDDHLLEHILTTAFMITKDVCFRLRQLSQLEVTIYAPKHRVETIFKRHPCHTDQNILFNIIDPLH